MKMTKENQPVNKTDYILYRYTFEINCESVIRTVTIVSESKSAAEKIAKRENPNCNVQPKWEHN
jgi:hypothetical protein